MPIVIPDAAFIEAGIERLRTREEVIVQSELKQLHKALGAFGPDDMRKLLPGLADIALGYLVGIETARAGGL